MTFLVDSGTLWLKVRDEQYDAAVTMYHDQGQVAIKLLGFDRGVSVPAGLPLRVTTPAHGTAFDIAGKTIAIVLPTRNAFTMCPNIASNRWCCNECFGYRSAGNAEAQVCVVQCHDAPPDWISAAGYRGSCRKRGAGYSLCVSFHLKPGNLAIDFSAIKQAVNVIAARHQLGEVQVAFLRDGVQSA